ncbi:prealbumin-like fold domain-containing protein [Bifidobacterium cebidarum]|uniref:prealbumin-like fold domain-containing protein n=1 Tax=Bifidobacterium cebidarum TaxID=2650773 RepID=UPI00186B53CD|nr:prealbumin-like fold domain-containing protein [Bifidobacterium cebidarum]
MKFLGNHANAAAFMSGGGAIYVKGELWILNDMNDSSKKPLFDGNWTAVGVGDDNTQYMNNDPKAGVLPVGGAGGAIFLQNGKSKGYFMGGEYKNNTSGYLGGAIYTEEDSVSYVGKAVATENVAGHFGGGLWLCPSGSALASEGGNIALFGNDVNYNIDANAVYNTINADENHMAGDDFAMMNPKGKDLNSTKFQLLSSWFMDRAESAVDWYWDGTPTSPTNGFSDDYQAPWWGSDSRSNSVKRYADTDTYNGVGYPQRYDGSVADDTALNHLKVTAPATLQPTNPEKAGKSLGDNTRAWDALTSTLTFYTGIAMKARLTAYGQKNAAAAKANAALSFTNNAARLSGGAFGSNGVVSFSSPYSASWDKVDADDTTKFLKGSVWTLKTATSGAEAGGAMNPSLRPADCTANAKATDASCWQTVTEKNADGSTTQWLSVEIADNGPRDTNPEIGKIGVDNLKPGKYYLTEKAAPDNYKLTTNVYTFTVVAEADGLQKEEPKISLYQQNDAPDNVGPVENDDTAIGNTIRSGGVSWSKINKAVANITSQAYLADSGWTLTKYKTDTSSSDMDASFGSVIIDDYVSADQSADRTCPANAQSKSQYCDINPGVGRFTVTDLPLGTYKLVESTVPGGYVTPDSDTYYTFTVEDGKTATLTKWENGQSTSTSDTEIVNIPTEIAWEKVASHNHDEALNGAKWTISKWENGQISDSREVIDCTTNECSAKSNSATAYVDKNPEAGHFGIQNLERGTEYKLTETQAPDGYTLPDPSNTYAIITVTDTGDAHMTLHGLWNQPELEDASVCLAPSATASVPTRAGSATECVLTNVRSVVALPFTGGMDARSWLLIGGIAAVSAAIVLALTNEYRKRKGLA